MRGTRIATALILLVAFAFPVGALIASGFASGGGALAILLDSRIHELLLNSLGLAALTTALAILLGAPLAVLFAFRRPRPILLSPDQHHWDLDTP